MPPAGYPAFLQYLQSGRVRQFESHLRTVGSRKHAMVKANRARRVIALAGDEKIRNLTLSEPARERVSI